MEKVLGNIATTAGSKFSKVKDAANVAKEQIACPNLPIHTHREKCLATVELALDTGHPKLSALAVEALQLIVRDDRFRSGDQTELSEQTLSMQLLNSLASLPAWNKGCQCHCLTVVVQLICSNEIKISLGAVQQALQLCMLTYGSSDEPSVRLAVRASITQMLNSFCSNLYGQAIEESQDELAIFMDMTTLINDCVRKLDQLSPTTEQVVIVLEAIYSILSTQPLQILKYQPFNNALWRDLCPCLMKLWGIPEKSSPCVVGRSKPSTDEPLGQGQIAGQFQSAARNIFETPDMARALYQILEQLIRLMASHQEMQSILQALFHKALLFPVVTQRLEALKVLKRILGDPARVTDLIRITVTNGSFMFWKLFLDCVVECSRCPTLDVTMEASRVADVLLETLEKMCTELNAFPEDLKTMLLKMETFDSTVFHYEDNDLPDLKDHTPMTENAPGSESSDSDEEEMKRALYESKEVINQRLQRLKQGMQRVPSLDPDVPPAPRSHRTDSQMAEDENLSSRRFMEKLADHIPVWLELKSTIEVDEHIQQFAADFYKEFTDDQKKVFVKHSLQPNQFLNGDALYLSIYAALSIARYGKTPPVNKEWFIKQVVGGGCIVYVSESWLGLIYDEVSKKSALNFDGKDNCALFEAIEDFSGVNAQMMSAEQKLAKIANRNVISAECLAVRKWTKALLASSWEGLIVVLSRFLLGKEKKKSKATNAKVIRGTQVSLHALQSLCRLLIQLDMGTRSGWIFEKLVENVCPLEELRVLSGIDDRSSNSWQMDRIDKWKVSKQDALSLEMVLDNAIECGLASAACWKHVIRCTEYLWELERYLFGSGGGEERKTSRWSLLGRDTSTQFNMVNLRSASDEMLAPEEQPLCGLFEASGEEHLDAVGTAKVICVLIAKAEKFYEKVGKWLNLDSLCEFMKSLVLASENRLRNSNFNSKMTDPCTLINRIALIILKIASRPLVHLMKVWPTITNHFIEAACTREQEHLTRSAISCLHDCQNALLIQEPNGFYFNQMLFVPLQTILCVDMSSEETQDQIVSVLSSFVHLSSEKIGSGWRPLFGALKAIRTSPLNNNSESIRDASHLSSVHATVLDVFSTFLDIRNPNILSLTMYECINCLLHYLQATASDSEESDTDRIEAQDNALGESAFLNLQKVDHILQKFFSIEMAPVPSLLHRLILRERSGDSMDGSLNLLDDVVPELSAVIADSDTAETDPSPLELDRRIEVPFPPFPWKELGLSQRCTAELYLSLIEGLTGVVVTCPRILQSRIFQHISLTTTNLIGSHAGLEFGAYSLSALILPMLQKWLRREILSDGWRDNTSDARNFKQAVGMFTEVVVDYVKADNENVWCNRILLDLFILLNECVAQPSEIISRLGCSCLKHLCVTAGTHFTETQWTISVRSLWKTTCISLHPIRRLMYHFFVSSTDYNGDVGNVQIALRQDSTSGEAVRIKIIAQQVFLLDSQQDAPAADLHSPDLFSQADRSVIFVLNLDKPGEGASEERVLKLPFRDVIISLLSQQLILQLLATILISEPTNCIPSGTSSLLRSIISEPEQLGSKLSRRSISTLFHCLDSSFQIAHEFDSRPGLKFLMQKVLNADVAANLYKQMVTAYTIKSLVLYGLARRVDGDPQDRKKFGRTLEKLCAQLGKLEKSTAEDKIAVLMREIVPQKVDFVLKEVSATETEQVFRIVSKQEVDGNLEEYKRQKKQTLPPSHPIRANPFAGASSTLQDEQKIIDEQQTKSRLKDADVRIAAFVEMVLASFELVQAEDDDTFKQLLPMFYSSVALANRNSASIRIRTFVSDLLEKLDRVYALCDK